MQYRSENPLVVQSDHSLLLETMGPHFKAARNALAGFAELVKSPDYVYTYRLTPLSLWNAAASGLTVEEVIGHLEKWSKYEVPQNIPVWIQETMGRYGRLRLTRDEVSLVLEAETELLLTEIRHLKELIPLLGEALDDTHSRVDPGLRGELKQALIKAGHPVDDLAGYTDGEALDIHLRQESLEGVPLALREYQVNAVDAFHGDGLVRGGSGVVVLPCGAGKTLVGMGVMQRLGMKTLVLCTNVTALRQWRDELLDKTDLSEEDIGEYSGQKKEIRPVTLATYQVLTYLKSRLDDFVHFGLFDSANWGLIIYDEVHLLPAPVFRAVAHLQARRRLGLTATLIREDNRQSDVFALIGPKRYDLPWKDLEHQGWIASAQCTEIRIAMGEEDRLRYAIADDREKFRIASTNVRKGTVLDELLSKHKGERVLILGMYLDQLNWISKRWKLPIITGQTKQSSRDQLFDDFRAGVNPTMVISKVGNFSVDLPDASVAIQVSGTWGSRQEEAQRLGRILRPKGGLNKAWFYSLVSRDTNEQEYAERRQLFLTEQGYSYSIESRK